MSTVTRFAPMGAAVVLALVACSGGGTGQPGGQPSVAPGSASSSVTAPGSASSSATAPGSASVAASPSATAGATDVGPQALQLISATRASGTLDLTVVAPPRSRFVLVAGAGGDRSCDVGEITAPPLDDGSVSRPQRQYRLKCSAPSADDTSAVPLRLRVTTEVGGSTFTFFSDDLPVPAA